MSADTDKIDPQLAQFEEESQRYFRRNFVAGLVHGVFFQASAAFGSIHTVLPAFVALCPGMPVVGPQLRQRKVLRPLRSTAG